MASIYILFALYFIHRFNYSLNSSHSTQCDRSLNRTVWHSVAPTWSSADIPLTSRIFGDCSEGSGAVKTSSTTSSWVGSFSIETTSGTVGAGWTLAQKAALVAHA